MSIPAGDLTLLRSYPQLSKTYLVIQQAQYRETQQGSEVWTGYDWYCRINGNLTDDPIASLTVDGGGAAVDLLDGMTVLISGTKYGDWDHGIYRIRGDQSVGPGTVSLDIGTSSEVRGNVEDDDYVVVLDEFRFWQRYGRIEIVADEPVWYKDYDIVWTDLGATDAIRRTTMMRPVPIMGPHAVKFVEIGGSSAQFYFDWSDSYATAPGEVMTDWVSSGETDHAGGTWNSVAEIPGWQTVDAISGLRGFRVNLQVDDGFGNAAIAWFSRGIRYVFTLRRPGETQDGDPPNAEPITDFEMAEPASGNFDQGYWRTSITVFGSQAAQYTIMPGALVILFTEDTYGTTEGSLGPIEDRENILMVGRIVDGSIRMDSESGDVTFDVASPGAEATLYHNYPIVIENDDASDDWIGTPDLTVDRAMHYYTTWHTTMNMIADVYQTDDTNEIFAMDFLEGDIYSTLDGFLQERIFARLLCDKYGRFFCEIDANEQPYGTAPTLWTLDDDDWLDDLTVRVRHPSPVNAVDCGGLIYTDGEVTPKLSHAPGLFDKYRGARQASNSLAIEDQSGLNTTCGRHLAALNYEHELDLQLSGNWRYCDIAPQEVVDVGTLATDRETLTGTYIIRSVTNTYDPEAGAILTEIQTEEEADDGVAGVTIDIPDELPSRTPIQVPRLPVYPGGPIGPVAEDLGRRIISSNVGVFATNNIGADSPVWYAVNSGLPADDTRYCWKIIRDPWHWWTTDGSERTLWGIFSEPSFQPLGYPNPRYIYKMENFPYGTWTEVLDAYTELAGLGAPNWVCDIAGSIESEVIYVTIHDKDSGVNAGHGYLIRTTDGGDSWTNLGQFSAVKTIGYPPWPGCSMALGLAHHSAAQTIYINQSFLTPPTDITVRKTTNAGGAWSDVPPNIPGWGNDVDGRISVPYHSASWTDTDVLVSMRQVTNNARGLQRSTNGGTTWTNIGEATVNYAYRAWSPFTYNRLIIAALYGSGVATDITYTSDGGSSWSTLVSLGYDVGYAALFAFTKGGIMENVLLSDVSGANIEIRLVSTADDLDKTGNLLSVATGIDTITRIERDSMGAA